jgi:hypothetical protein
MWRRAEERVGQAQENKTEQPKECLGGIQSQETFSCLQVIEISIVWCKAIIFSSGTAF